MRDFKGRFIKGHGITEEIRKKMSDAKIGKPSWNKGKKVFLGKQNPFFGKKHTEESIEKNRNAHLGKPTWNKGKRIKQIAGKNHYLWKGTTPLNKSIRNSTKYANWRKQIFERDDYTCQICRIKGGGLVVDHFPKSFAELIDIFEIKTIDDALDCDELWSIEFNRTLCNDCHLQTPNFGKRNSIVGGGIQKWQHQL